MRSLIISAAVILAGCSGESSTEPQTESKASPQAAAQVEKAADGPFGFELGGEFAAVEGLEKGENPGVYLTSAPPKPHVDFEQVVVIAYPETGICLVRGIGNSIQADGAGVQIRTKVDGLREALETKYGKARSLDRCVAGDIACDSQFWMMTLSQRERMYGADWEKPNDGMKKSNIGSIYLVAAAEDIATTYPLVEYHSASNRDACLAAEKKAQAAAL